MRSPTAARMPSVATLPLTFMRPASMCSSILRLAPSPARDITFCRRSASAFGAAARASARAPACRRPVLFGLVRLPRVFGSLLPPGALRLVDRPRFGPVLVFFRVVFDGVFDSPVGLLVDGVVRLVLVRLPVGFFRLCVRLVVFRLVAVGLAVLVVFLRVLLVCLGLLVIVCRLGVFGVVERKFRLDIVEVSDLGQCRQIVEALESEVVEERLGRSQQFGLARYVAMA